ncbi:MAG: matrixin family metalloprotease [Myxococcales bacterium]|nr:matrixin family metalloprotease [Myxococcales bacterium]
MKRIVLVSACLAGLVSAPSADAYRRLGSQFNPRALPVAYRINRTSIPASLGVATGVAAIEQGFATWSAPSCTTWATSNAGDTTRTRAQAGDRENSMLWISGSWPSELGAVNVTIGVTTPVWSQGGFFIDADIQYNNVGFRWSTTGTNNTVDAQSIATHENGHFLGLDHSSVQRAVMFASYSGGLKRELDADDIAGVCALYPSGGAVPDAGTPNDPCNQYTSCAGCTPVNGCGWCGASNRCVSATQSGPTAGACASGFAWLPNQCTTAQPQDAGTATDPCNQFASCGACTPVNGCGWCGASNRCVRSTQSGPTAGACASGFAWLPQECSAGGTDAGTPTGTASFGEPCRQLQDCGGGGLCVGTSSVTPFCTRVCTDDCTCPRGYACNAMLQTGQRVCFPGTNRCVADAGSPVLDSGVAPPLDTGVVVTPDTGVVVTPDTGNTEPPTDTGNPMPEDAGNAAEDTGPALPREGGSTSTCACATVGTTSPLSRGGLSLGLGLAAMLVGRRRRRTAR